LAIVDALFTLRIPARRRGLYSLAFFFVCTGLLHFKFHAPMSAMIPPWVPGRLTWVYVTGVLEILGAIGLLIPALRRAAGIGLILLLVGVLPANVYAALHHMDTVGHGSGPIFLLLRIPLQFFLIGWTYLCAIDIPNR
jgi:uncharacterized membrane protein